jgi:hydroxymethylpyrimidine/phosphomethylpyrimidine kinase
VKGRVLIIAGSDPSGGAGAQADIKTVTALGGYAAAAITALTVQNTRGVFAVHPVAPEIIRAQIVAVLDDIGADAIKIGMIPTAEAARALAALVKERSGVPVVLDPVLISTSGDALAGEGVSSIIRRELAPSAAALTPNIDELAALTGETVESLADARRAGRRLRDELKRPAIVVKGGHLKGASRADLILTRAGETELPFEPISTRSFHGAGCTLASAIATGLAQGLAIEAAAARAAAFVREAIRTAPAIGGGHGPLNHAHSIPNFKRQRLRAKPRFREAL